MKILLILPGTYPYRVGGVSTWAHNLISNLSDLKFDILAVADGIDLTPKFSIPPNVERIYLVKVGLGRSRNNRSHELMRDLREEFITSLRLLLDYLLGRSSCELAAKAVCRLHRLFVRHGEEVLFRCGETWSFFKRYFSGKDWLGDMTIGELSHTIRLLGDLLKPLEMDLERYEIKSKGAYGVLSKNYLLGGRSLGFHLGANYSFEKKDGDDDLSLFLGLDKSLNEELSVVAEYDLALNDDRQNGAFGAGRGYLNLGLRWNIERRFFFELDIKNLTDNIENISAFDRELRVVTLQFF